MSPIPRSHVLLLLVLAAVDVHAVIDVVHVDCASGSDATGLGYDLRLHFLFSHSFPTLAAMAFSDSPHLDPSVRIPACGDAFV